LTVCPNGVSDGHDRRSLESGAGPEESMHIFRIDAETQVKAYVARRAQLPSIGDTFTSLKELSRITADWPGSAWLRSGTSCRTRTRCEGSPIAQLRSRESGTPFKTWCLHRPHKGAKLRFLRVGGLLKPDVHQRLKTRKRSASLLCSNGALAQRLPKSWKQRSGRATVCARLSASYLGVSGSESNRTNATESVSIEFVSNRSCGNEMRKCLNILRFEMNVPTDVVLGSCEGIAIEGRYGTRAMFPLADGRVMYVPPIVASRIQEEGIVPGERFQICKAAVRIGQKRSVEWMLQRVHYEQPPEPAADGIEAAIPEAQLEHDSRASVEMANTNNANKAGLRLEPKPCACIERSRPFHRCLSATDTRAATGEGSPANPSQMPRYQLRNSSMRGSTRFQWDSERFPPLSVPGLTW